MRTHPFLPRASQHSSSILMPANLAMQFLMVLLILLALCLFPIAATASSPHIYDAPQAGPPGSQTQAVGNGWDPNANIDIYFDSTEVGLVVADSNGSFGMALKAPTIRQNGLAIQIPKDAVPGQHWITAVERITQLTAQVAFTVSADWPQYQFGPDHTAVNPYENILSPETAGNLTTRWRYLVGGDIVASPTVANGVVYISSINGNKRLYALDAGTGTLIWTYQAPVGGAAAVANGIVYFSVNNRLWALNAKSGGYLWDDPLSCSPVIANGVIYCAADAVYALNASTGVRLWRHTTGDSGFGGITVANGVLYVGAYNNDPSDDKLYALDASTGAFLWEVSLLGGIGGEPSVVNGVVYVTRQFYYGNDYAVYALDAHTGAIIWQHVIDHIAFGQAVSNGVVYVGSGSVLDALDAATGSLLWQYAAAEDTADMYPPSVANGVVYFGVNSLQQSGTVYVLNAATGALLWSYPLPGGSLSSPAVVNGKVYIGNNTGYLYTFGLPNQQMSEKFKPPQHPDPMLLAPDWSLQPNKPVIPALKK